MNLRKYPLKAIKIIVKLSNIAIASVYANQIRKRNSAKSTLVVFFSPKLDSNSHELTPMMAMLLPIAYGFSKRGDSVSFLIQNNVLGLRKLNYSASIFNTENEVYCDRKAENVRSERSASARWLTQREFDYKGVNYFDVCVAFVRQKKRKYTVSFADSNDCKLLKLCLNRCKYIHESLESLASTNHRRKVYVVGNETNHLPNSAIAWFCSKKQLPNLDYIDFNRGYQHYWGAHFREFGMACRNKTYNDEGRHFVTPQELKAVLEKPFEPLIYNALPSRPSTHSISNYCRPDDFDEVFCLYAHVAYDVRIPDSSPGYVDMVHWINSICEHFAKDPTKLLLIKPHPSEATTMASKAPNETVEGMVCNYYKSLINIVLLPPGHFFNLNSVVDCALVWRSSVGLELAASGKPVILCGNPDYRYLPFNKVESEADFDSMLDKEKYRYTAEELPTQALAYLAKRRARITKMETIRYLPTLDIFYFEPFQLLKCLWSGGSEVERDICDQILAETDCLRCQVVPKGGRNA